MREVYNSKSLQLIQIAENLELALCIKCQSKIVNIFQSFFIFPSTFIY